MFQAGSIIIVRYIRIYTMFPFYSHKRLIVKNFIARLQSQRATEASP